MKVFYEKKKQPVLIDYYLEYNHNDKSALHLRDKDGYLPNKQILKEVIDRLTTTYNIMTDDSIKAINEEVKK